MLDNRDIKLHARNKIECTSLVSHCKVSQSISSLIKISHTWITQVSLTIRLRFCFQYFLQLGVNFDAWD
jgi:hypothetical protein